MQEQRVVIVGPAGAGKTTAIQTIRQAREEFGQSVTANNCPVPILRGEEVDDEWVHLRDGQAMQLLGARGCQMNPTLHKLLQQGVDGIIILISNAAPNPLAELAQQLKQLGALAGDCPLAIGVSHVDTAAGPGIEEYRAELDKFTQRPHSPPLLLVDPRSRLDIGVLLDAALYVDQDALFKGAVG